MSKYTTEVRFICETSAGYMESQGYSKLDDILDKAAPVIFDFDFPIFDEAYRLPLEKKILKHYYTREIGEETVGLWKLRLNATMNEIMPYYNKLYESELLEFNPLYDVDIKTERTISNDGSTSGEQTNTGSSSSETTDNGTMSQSVSDTTKVTDTKTSNSTETPNTVDWDYYSETPQGGINGIDDNSYLTNARKKTQGGTTKVDSSDNGTSNTEKTATNESESTNNSNTSVSTNDITTSSSTVKNTEDYIETVTGKRGGTTYASMIKEFRETFMNIDKMIIDDLATLFFGLW